MSESFKTVFAACAMVFLALLIMEATYHKSENENDSGGLADMINELEFSCDHYIVDDIMKRPNESKQLLLKYMIEKEFRRYCDYYIMSKLIENLAQDGGDVDAVVNLFERLENL